MNFRILLFVVATAIVMAASGCATGSDAKKIQGTWSVASAEIGGKPFPPQVAKVITLKMDDGKYEAKSESLDKGTYTIDPSAKPKTIDVFGTEGPNAGKHFPCIYELQDDTLTICYQLGDGPRPAEFTSPAGTAILLITYQRKAE